jgi:hypothetical protein
MQITAICQELSVQQDSCIIPLNELKSNLVQDLVFTKATIGNIYDGEKFLLFTNEKELKRHYGSFGNKSKIDSAIKYIDFEKNNVIIFNLITGGSTNPEIQAKIYKEKLVQIYVKLIGAADVAHHNLRHVLIPKQFKITNEVYVIYSYKY